MIKTISKYQTLVKYFCVTLDLVVIGYVKFSVSPAKSGTSVPSNPGGVFNTAFVGPQKLVGGTSCRFLMFLVFVAVSWVRLQATTPRNKAEQVAKIIKIFLMVIFKKLN